MQISVTIFVILISTFVVTASLLEPVVENIVHINATHSPHGDPGIWRKKTIWKPRWVKEWKSAKVMKPTWRKVWSPVFIKEWIPIPKPPSDWESKSTSLASLNVGPDGKMPLWDPMPYPESQQPPPAPLSPPFPPLSSQNFKNDQSCGFNGCNHHDPPLDTFTLEQISKIIGSNRFKKEVDLSSSTKLTKVLENTENWRTRRENSFKTQGGRGFNNLPDLPLYLIPPKFEQLRNNGINFQNRHIPNLNDRKNQFTNLNRALPQHGGNHQWTPIANQNKAHSNNFFNNKPNNQPFKLQFSNINSQLNKGPPIASQQQNFNIKNLSQVKQNKKNLQPTTNKTKFQNDPNFIQQAELVGEYHYSDVDNVNKVKFKPLPPSAPSLPLTLNLPITELKSEEKKISKIKPSSPSTEGKPRPIRKDPEPITNNNQPQLTNQFHRPTVPTLPPRTIAPVFEQEKAITKEVISITTQSTRAPNHKYDDIHPVYMPTVQNSTLNKNFSNEARAVVTQVENSGNAANNINHFHVFYAKANDKQSDRNLINALQKNIKKETPEIKENTSQIFTTTSTPMMTTTKIFTSTVAPTTTLPSSSASPEINTKSPVFIVTPIYQRPST